MTRNSSRNTLVIARRIVTLFSALPLIIVFTVAVAQQLRRTLAKIEVEGLQRLSSDEVIATSGLKVGTQFSVEELDAAGQRLVDSGLFGKVGYRTTTKGNQITVVFQVTETKGGQSPVVFDNFVWFTNDQLVAAIKREVPSFNGTASDSGHMTDDIKRALDNLLQENQIKGTVDYAPMASGGKQVHLFTVIGIPIPICTLHFPGARNISEAKLIKSSKQLTDADYSQTSAVAFSTFILFPIYREAGQLRAKFAQPIAKLDASANCKGGVELNIPVEEGPVYLWDKAEWTGNVALSAKELNEALGMKRGEVANGVKIDKRLHEVGATYGRTGHLDLSLNAQPEFDDSASRVGYKIGVREGPQYRMGKLIIKGLNDAETKSLQQRWKLKSGDVFDTSYLDRFISKDASDEMERIIAARRTKGKGLPDIRHEITPDRQTLTADLTIEFKD